MIVCILARTGEISKKDISRAGEVFIKDMLIEPEMACAALNRVQYLHRLKTHVREEFGGVFAAVNSISEDGLYIHKRPVRVMGDALGQTAVLQQAGSVFHHVILYVKAGDQVNMLVHTLLPVSLKLPLSFVWSPFT